MGNYGISSSCNINIHDRICKSPFELWSMDVCPSFSSLCFDLHAELARQGREWPATTGSLYGIMMANLATYTPESVN